MKDIKKIMSLKNNAVSYFLICLVIIGSILRIYNIPYRYSLGEETVRDAVIGIQGARELQFPLTGAFSSLGPFTFGPWYAYQMILFTIISPFHYSPWVYLTILSIAYIILMYKIGEILEGKFFGLMLAFLSTFSPAQIISATHLTSHNMTNIFAVGALFIFLKLMKREISYWWSFALGFLIGIGMNLHFQMSGLLVLPVILLFHRRKKPKYFFISLVGVAATFLPLFFFEANNHWFNTKNIFYYILYGKNAIYVPNRWLFYVRDFWPAFWADALGVSIFVADIIIVVFLLTVFLLGIKKKLSFSIIMLLAAFLSNFILLRYYWGPRFFGYLNFLRPFVFIFTSLTFTNLLKLYPRVKYIWLLAFFSIPLFALPMIRNQLNQDPFTLRVYDQIKTLNNRYPGEKFTIYGCSLHYSGAYNAFVFSSVFLLDKEKQISDNGKKIAVVAKDCPVPSTIGLTIDTTDFVDFTTIDKKILEGRGWKPVTFPSIYELNARWWFKEQP